MSEPKKIVPKPADIRSISDPPDMGRLRPAEEAARLFLGRPFPTNIGLAIERGSADVATSLLADLIRQCRAEGAVAALEDVADAFEMSADENEEAAGNESLDGHHDRAKSLAIKAEAYAGIAAILRARIKTISDPPDMG